MPLARVRTSGQAVDLFGPAMDVAEWTGVLPAVRELDAVGCGPSPDALVSTWLAGLDGAF